METDHQQRGHDSLPSTMVAGRPLMVAEESGPEKTNMAHDSLVTVRLSEPDSVNLGTSATGFDVDVPRTLAVTQKVDEKDNANADADADVDTESEPDKPGTEAADTTTPRHSTAMPPPIIHRNLQTELVEVEEEEEVNWEQLEKTEDEQTKDEETDNSTALLLARLEQENAKLATNPKSVKVQAVDRAIAERSAVSKPRPPSMAQLRQMVNGPTPPALRYSMLPPPPMTDLEFYAALVKDYQQTAARLPTLLSNKIRKGIPPPLRGVVWQSMSGARDAVLEEQFERFSGESSPYELIIGKDLGRSFPGVDMFRDPEGDGQRMLGRVLKCFSLYDTKIGYCQGLAFLVGPLLMHMPDKQAFCVLVRLMERYDLRACFLPDLSGLHVRIYQFRELLRQSLPVLSNHLEELQVDPAYVSQWFLSFFAVTCPLPMLFRIYDVIFAEGASETLMRVALSLMRKNEARLLACPELEDVMQLLLSRGLWDCYHYNADEFVQDFVGLTSVVSRESLSQLEQGYRESKIATTSQGRSSDITTAATRFLGRIWASSTTSLSPKSANLSPGLGAPSRPLSMLRRSTSKQSLASTLNSMEASSSSVASSASTEATTLSRDSSNTEDGSLTRESTPVGPKSHTTHKNNDERYLHSQIEDLLTALSELQRNHALLSNQLQREREERTEDRKAVQWLLDGLRKKAATGPATTDTTTTETTTTDTTTTNTTTTVEAANDKLAVDGDKKALDATDRSNDDKGEKAEVPSAEDLSELLDRVEQRFQPEDQKRRSSMMQTKAQMREELSHTKDQLASAMSHSQDLSRQIHDLSSEMTTVKEQLRESHAHVRTLHQDKQRLERQIHGMRARASASSAQEPARDVDADGNKAGGGLREFKLGRSKSTPSQASQTSQAGSGQTGGGPTSSFGKRVSSLPQPHDSGSLAMTGPSAAQPNPEAEALLLELVQAKTAEAMAKQEVEEMRQKLEALRKAHGMGHGDHHGGAAAVGAAAGGPGAMGVFGRLTGHGHGNSTASENMTKPPGQTPTPPVSGGGFWGWRR